MEKANQNAGRTRCGGLLVAVEENDVFGKYPLTPLKRCPSCGAQIRTFDIRCAARVIKPKTKNDK